jgi:hypothetical protein
MRSMSKKPIWRLRSFLQFAPPLFPPWTPWFVKLQSVIFPLNKDLVFTFTETAHPCRPAPSLADATSTGSVEKSRQRRSLPSPERLRVYALERFDAQARRQVAIFPCSRTRGTLRASKWLWPFLRAASGQVWTDPSGRLRACFFEPDPESLNGNLILDEFARDHLHYSTLLNSQSHAGIR